MERFETPAAVFRDGAKDLADENFRAVADAVDAFSLSLFRDELLNSERTLPYRDRLMAAASPAEAFIEWLRQVSSRARISRMVESGEIAKHIADELCTPHPPLPALVLVGVVEEQGEFAHLLYRTPAAVPDPALLNHLSEDERSAYRALATYARISIAQARRQLDGTWRLIAGRTFLNFNHEYMFGPSRVSSEHA